MGKHIKYESTTMDDQGKIVVSTKSYKVGVNIEPFFATFTREDHRLYRLTATQYQIMIYLCKKMKLDTGEVDITPSDRKKMMAFFDVSKGAISLGLAGLLKAKILAGKSGEYYINPELFWKGSPVKREELVKTQWFEDNFK